MKKIAIVTDSNSGITQEMGKTMGIHVIPMPFFIDGELFLEDITLTQEEFYKRLGEDSDISTSQPSPGEVMECWDELLKEYDEIVHIPMSSGLSSTCHAAQSLSQEYEGKVCVVDNQRISVTQKQSVEDAIVLRDAGKSAAEIKENPGSGKIAGKHLYYSGYIKVFEKRRADHTGCRCAWDSAELKAGASDPGRQTGCILKGERMEGRETHHAQSY